MFNDTKTIKQLLLKAVKDGPNLTLDDIEALLSITEENELERLWSAADVVRQQYIGKSVWLRGLVEFSNYCSCNCRYCGLRASNTKLERYRMTPQEILACVEQISSHQIGTVVLQSGEDPWWTAERIGNLVRAIKTKFDIAITLSVGNRTRDELELWRKAGADRYLLRHETANSKLYKSLHPDSTLDDRVNMLNDLRDLGYEIGSGCMVGLPGQTITDLASDIVLARDLEVDMFGVGPFIPHPDTPLGKEGGGTALLTYKMIAVLRLVLRDVHFPVTTALATLDPYGRELGWQRGANVVMPNATPAPYRQQYELYQDKRCLYDTLNHCTCCLARRIASVGRKIGQGHGGSLKKHKLTQATQLRGVMADE